MSDTIVKLRSKSLDETREFDIAHAERILQYQDKYPPKDWELNDTNFVYNDGTIKRAGNKADKNSPQRAQPQKGD
jgi:hypothetical protein